MNFVKGKSVLIVCFSFPPNPGIGGRRWAKLAKGLVQLGHEVHVVRAKFNNVGELSNWSEDVNGVQVTEIPRMYPSVIHNNDLSSIQKIKYKIAIRYLKATAKGSIYDPTVFWKKALQKELHKLVVVKGFVNVIVTGAPFNLMYYGALFKEENQSINLLLDFRDPWLGALNYGMTSLNESRRKYEEKKFQFSVKWADKIISPSKHMLNDIVSYCEEKEEVEAKCIELKHFYDESNRDYSVIENDEILIVYAGALYRKIKDALIQLDEALSVLMENNFELYNKVKVKFYSEGDYSWIFDKHVDKVEFLKPIGNKINDELRKARFILILLADHTKNFRTTKYFDFAPYRIPYLYCGPSGDVSKHIVEDEIGYVLREHDLIDLLKKPKCHGYNYDSESLENRTNELDLILI